MREKRLPRSGAAMAGARIGLLGGSFNPAHRGHLEISLYAMKRLRLDMVWWLVSPQNPLKPREGMSPLGQRLAGARKMSERHPRIIATDIEAELGTVYTVDTLHKLKSRFPAVRFVWMMGADNMEQIVKWRRWADIFREVPIAVFRRPGHSAGLGMGKAAVRFAKAWMRRGAASSLPQAEPPAWMVLENRLEPLSSSRIRAEDAKKRRVQY